MSRKKEESQVEELKEIKQFVDNEKAKGNRMFVSGWDDDCDDIEPEVNPHKNKNTEIIWAAENGKIDIVKSLAGEDNCLVSTRDPDGYTPLHRACYNDHVDVVEYLISVGADVAARTVDGWTPLHSASHWNNALCAVKLLENGADINALTNGGQTALHLAAAHGASKETLELLLNHPLIDPSLVNKAGETAATIARRSGVFYCLFEIFEDCMSEIPDMREETSPHR